MGRYASEVINQAKAWIGKKESNGSHKEIIDLYNTQNPLPRNYKVTYKDAWCATFVSAVAVKLGYTTIIPTECSCERMIELFRALDCFVEDESVTPAPGWIIFYDWNDSGKGNNKGYSDHTGIIEKVSGGKITVIEGNYSDSVKRRTLKVNGKYIRGYGVPRYDKEPSKKSVTDIAREVIAGKWGNGSERKRRLTSAGYNYSEVQKKVNEILK